MSDTSNSTDNSNSLSLFVLFLTLFCILFLISAYVIAHGLWKFCSRYCVRTRSRLGCCCCAINVDAYRRERDSLQRLRELRRIHRFQTWQQQQQQQGSTIHIYQTNDPRNTGASGAGAGLPLGAQISSSATGSSSTTHQYPTVTGLATFSQIPGPIPSHTTPTTTLRGEIPELATFSQIPGPIPNVLYTPPHHHTTIMGFVLVDATRHASSLSQHDAAEMTRSFALRDQLSPEKRRAILDQLLVCKIYHCRDGGDDDDAGESVTAETVEEGRRQVKEKDRDEPTLQPQEDTTESDDDGMRPQSYAFPLHEEPATPELTCAICLDGFVNGEYINDTSKCPHVFHRTCLLEWLDKHDVCPCCRRPMITNEEWRRVAEEQILSAAAAATTTTTADGLTTGTTRNGLLLATVASHETPVESE